MEKGFTVRKSTEINASVSDVWDALINPVKIKEYLFGTNVISDWKVGSKLIYKGVWEGKEYEDHGTILQLVPEKIFQSTYWSPVSGLPDIPENYNTVTYTLEKVGNGTLLTLTQDNNKTEEANEHAGKNWEMVLDGLKKMLEKR